MTPDLPIRAARTRELAAFLILTAVVMPLLTVGTVGGYGLAVWCWQMIAGPPGPSSTHTPATAPAPIRKG